MVEIQSVTASDNLQMNGALELSENLAEGGQVGEGTPDTEDSALGVFKADYLEVRNVEHRSSKTSSERRKGWALVPLRTAPPLTLILTGLFLVALLLILGKQYLPGKRYAYVRPDKNGFASGTLQGRMVDTDTAVADMMAKLQTARKELELKSAARVALEAEQRKRILKAREIQQLELEELALAYRDINIGLLSIMSKRVRSRIGEFRTKWSPVTGEAVGGKTHLGDISTPMSPMSTPIIGVATRLHQDRFPFDEEKLDRPFYAQLVNGFRKLLDEATRNTERQRFHLHSLEGIEHQMRNLRSTQQQLKARLDLLRKRDINLRARRDTLHVSGAVELIVERWRVYIMHHLSRQHFRILTGASKMKGTLKKYEAHSLCRHEDIKALAINLQSIMKGSDRWMKDQKALDLVYDMAWSVKLGVSKRLNERQLAWEDKRAAAVHRLRGVVEVLPLKETEEEKTLLADIKEELKLVVDNAKKSNVVEDHAQPQSPVLLTYITETCDPVDRPDQLFVRNFRSVGLSGGEGINAYFTVVRLLGDGASAVVVEVQFLDMNLRQAYGNLAMKIVLGVAEDRATKTDALRRLINKRVDTELSALENIADPGETALEVTQRTGVMAAHYVGSLSVSDDSIPDMINIFLSPTSPVLSMKTRVYIAQSLLRSVAHLHSKSFCHNDLKAENAGITTAGEVVLFDCDSVAKAGQPRAIWTKTNLPPEAISQMVEKGWVRGDLTSDSWGLGVMLYIVLSGGCIPFFESDASILDRFMDPKQQLAAAEMSNVESPAFNLLRRGVPRVWINIVTLLLHRNAAHRPSPLQILEAYPEVSQGPVRAVRDANGAL